MKTNLKHLLCSIAALAMLASCSMEQAPTIQYIPAKKSESDKWGLADAKGQFLFENEFDNAPSVVLDGVFSVAEGKDNLYSVYRAEAKPVLVKGCEGLKSVGNFSEGLIAVVHPDERIKFVDKDGAEKFELTPVNNHEVESCSGIFVEGKLWIKLDNGKYGFINTSGKVVIEPKYDDIASAFVNGRAAVILNNKDAQGNENPAVQIINEKGEKVYALKDSQKFRGLSPDYVIVEVEDRIEVLNFKGELINKFPDKVNHVFTTDDKDLLIFISDDFKFGVINIKNETIVRPKYSSLQEMGNKFVAVKEDKKGVDILTHNGDVEKNLDFPNAYYIKDFTLLVGDEHEFYFYNTAGECDNKVACEDVETPMRNIVESDYFDASSVAAAAFECFSDGTFFDKGIKLGATPAQIKAIADNKDDFKYTRDYNFDITDSRLFSLKGAARFTGYITEDVYESETEYYFGYPYTYRRYVGQQLNADAKAGLILVDVNLNTKDKAKDVTKALIATIKKGGATELASGDSGAVLKGKDGKTWFVYTSGERETLVGITDNQEAIKAICDQVKESRPDISDVAVEEVDTAVPVEEVVEVVEAE